MLAGRVYRIAQRYADAHVSIDGDVGQAQAGAGGATIQSVQVRNNRLRVSVSARADTVDVQVNRTIARADIRQDDDGLRLFCADIPLEIGPIIVRVQAGDTISEHTAPAISQRRLTWARLGKGAAFIGLIAGLLPEIYRWKWQGDLRAREVVKERLGLVPRPTAISLDPRVFSGVSETKPDPKTATLVMPVFNAFDLLPEVLDRIERHSGSRWRLVLVEDCSTDERVRPWLQAWSADPVRSDRVHLLTMPDNSGFVRSANSGLEQAQTWPEDPVVLINSDAFVPAGWLDRLLYPLSDPTVASVTPMSNDAEIFSVPVICQRTQIGQGAVDLLDAVAATLDPVFAQTEVPTGVGFCMAMAPAFLQRVPSFDLAFGRGYGEENDWCQKLIAMGGRHVAAGNVFVEHRGGVSFGSAAKQKLLEQNLAIIAKRYPSYEGQVRHFIETDPLSTARMALGMAWASANQEDPVPVYLAHALGGGADINLNSRIARRVADGGSAVVIRVGLLRRWQVELHTGPGQILGVCDDGETLVRLIECLPTRRIVYSCGVGDKDPIELPKVLLQLAGDGAHPLEVLMHDYYPISPSYTLLGADRQYRGVPVAGGPLAGDRAHRQGGYNLSQWQEAWGALMRAASRIEVFSNASEAIVAQAYPEARHAIEVIPHEVTRKPPRIVVNPRGVSDPVIGVLGNIGVQKGAAVVQSLAKTLAQQGAGGVVVIGYIDPAYHLPAPSKVHGAYELRDLPGLVARYGIDCWLIPSVWPETFSFTTHEALATGMPVFTFDLGAQAEAVARAVACGAPGGVLPMPTGSKIDAKQILEHPSFQSTIDGSAE